MKHNLGDSKDVMKYNGVSQVILDNRICSFDELPLTLTVEDLAEILGICKAKAYELCRSNNFPSIKMGKRFIIPRPAFQLWMENPKEV